MNAAAKSQKPTPAPRSRYPERRRRPTREDIIRGLNRLSSAVYILMLKCVQQQGAT